ncbi:MAG TPA: hypothetical protein VJ484_11485 [Lysobacter sp.]|nr:hypothetical protein [Lysobacter sp.]
MTTGPYNRETDIAKLDADERDLAARMARIGPFDGPSPSLDAKILAAAHAAAATRKPNRRGHWLAWIGVPPAMVTGVGVAAAAVLALGLVWQLRPRMAVLPAGDEAAAGSGEGVFIAVEPAPATRAPVVNPPPFPAAPAPPAAPAAASAQTPTLARAQAEKAAAPPDAALAADAAAEAPAMAAPVMEEPAAIDAPVASNAASNPQGFAAERLPAPAATAATARNHATYTSAARATAERRERAAVDAAPAPPAQAAAASAAAAAEQDSTTLDRIEVSGSRLKRGDAEGYEPLSKVSVKEDVRLESGEWLERIRARRGEGDLDGARASLRLFRRDHPRVRIPDDLRFLLADPKQ